ncbi:unnamed protein product [Fusarium graminearum]|uniref:Uncharacterized protein n=1 Tax=Gibberella zeae TaxID=5518 RepID=A0A2H3G3B7_GIBZA|nr:hypothetical protein HG531_011321 [Fusarium graminearum]PCD19963.1 hypothetical protein FGRA07_05712 [Fusarium graminearum]CAF3476105.1 unnamed protein product [Fusarium graminearum]CAF3637851.1 unnamed protein product [Fusarium graminearum]CAG1975160.1 unnamed protein product [Fusarium graminearum]
MCKPVRYVYPRCGHPIIQDKYVWSVERCPFAQCTNRDCWISNNIRKDLIEDTSWPFDNLTEPCPLFHERDDSETATLAASSSDGDRTSSYETCDQGYSTGDQDSSCYETCLEFILSERSTPQPEGMNEEELDRMITDILFQEGLPTKTSGEVPGEEVLYTNEDIFQFDEDSLPSVDQFLLDEDEPHYFDTGLPQEMPFTNDQLTYYNNVVYQTGGELPFASIDDQIEWEQVRAVEEPLEQNVFGQDLDMEWRFDEWF